MFIIQQQAAPTNIVIAKFQNSKDVEETINEIPPIVTAPTKILCKENFSTRYFTTVPPTTQPTARQKKTNEQQGYGSLVISEKNGMIGPIAVITPPQKINAKQQEKKLTIFCCKNSGPILTLIFFIQNNNIHLHFRTLYQHFFVIYFQYRMLWKTIIRASFSGYTPSIRFPPRHGSTEQVSSKTVKMTNRQALNSAMDEEMARDSNVFLIGQEVAQYNGAYKISKGLMDKYGIERVVDTPIAEAGFTGIGIGSALKGLRPIVEFMTMNFSLQSIDQIINSAVKLHYMSAGRLSCPIVFRGLNGPAAAVAAQHSQCFASLYANIPGLITLAPYDAEDCKGLLKAAIRNDNPVMFLENENLYGESFEVKEEVQGSDFVVPIGKAKIMREGTDVTVIGFSRNVKFCMEAAKMLEKEGISCEVINLRSIRPLDRDCLVESAIKTGRVVTVEDDFPQSGVGSEICALMYETAAFNYLLGPVQRVTSCDVPMPYAKLLEDNVVPREDSIVKSVRNIMEWK